MNVRSTDNTQQPEVVLVIGGTGKTGRRVVDRLVAGKAKVRSVSRSTSIPFDWHDPASWGAALQDVKSIYMTYSPDLAVPGATAAIGQFVDQAVAAGVERLVLLSGRGEAEAQACERIVQQTDTQWTIVRASWFMQNFSEGQFLDMVLDGTITLPAGDIPEPFVDVNDIADVVVAALTEEGHDSEIYELTGPRAMTFAEVADEIARACRREIHFESIPQAAFVQAIEQSGAPADVAWLLDYLFGTVLDGRNSQIQDGVERALGRAPADFATYAQRISARGLWAGKPNEAVA